MIELSEDAGRALRTALGAEHAAVWLYGLASAFATGDRVGSAMETALAHHRGQRDGAERVLRDAGQQPPTAEPAYLTPEPVTDERSAILALVTAEHDCAIGWRSVLENTEGPELRPQALDGLLAAATRATRWRLTISQDPAAQSFPGQPT